MKRTALKRSGSPLRRVSAKRAKESRLYTAKRAVFLAAHPYCQVWLAKRGLTDTDVSLEGFVELPAADPDYILNTRVPRSEEVHHTRGRTGTNYLDESTWLAVCADEHRWLHDNPSEARARGWLLTGRAAR